MKKFILPICAFVLAIAFSSFSTSSKLNTAVDEDPYFWYPVENGVISGPRLNNTEVTRTAAMNTPAITTCKDHDAPLCIVGSHQSDLEADDALPAPEGDNYIRKTIE